MKNGQNFYYEKFYFLDFNTNNKKFIFMINLIVIFLNIKYIVEKYSIKREEDIFNKKFSNNFKIIDIFIL